MTKFITIPEHYFFLKSYLYNVILNLINFVNSHMRTILLLPIIINLKGC